VTFPTHHEAVVGNEGGPGATGCGEGVGGDLLEGRVQAGSGGGGDNDRVPPKLTTNLPS